MIFFVIPRTLYSLKMVLKPHGFTNVGVFLSVLLESASSGLKDSKNSADTDNKFIDAVISFFSRRLPSLHADRIYFM
jgi:hypothetical protein